MLDRWFHARTLPIGIDVGSSAAKLMQLRAGKGAGTVVAAARVPLPTGAEAAADPAAALARAAARRVEAGGFHGRRCILSVDNRLLRVRSVRLPRMSDEELTQSFALDGAERLGLPPGETEVGWIRAGEVRQGDDIREEVILVGAPARTLERAVDTLAECGLQTLAVEPAFLACARAMGRYFRRQADQRHVRIIVDAGSGSTAVIVLRGDKVAFCKLLEWGGGMLDTAASAKLGLDPEAVNEIRRQRRLANLVGSTEDVDARVDRAIYDAVRPLLLDLANEITMCMRYWMVTFRGERPEGIVVVGGEAEEVQLIEAVAESTGVETKIGRPLDGMDLSAASFLGADRRGVMAQWAVAAGLCLRAQQEDEASKPGKHGARAGVAA